MFQVVAIALAQVKADSTSKNLLNEVYQIIYSCIEQTKILKNVYNNIMKRYNTKGINTRCTMYL